MYEGYPLKEATKTLKVGGRDVTENLVKLLAEMGHHFCSTKDMKVVNDLKEKHCLVDNPDIKVLYNSTYTEKSATANNFFFRKKIFRLQSFNCQMAPPSLWRKNSP